MFSIPPATTMSLSPISMLCAASITAFIPEAHTLFTAVHGTSAGMPAPNAACFAGDCPRPACSTQPMNTSSTAFFFIPARSRAPFMAIAPNLVAGTSLRIPQKLPIGVRAAATMTACLRSILFVYVCVIFSIKALSRKKHP